MTLTLHAFHSSSTSYRARIALELKGLAFELQPVELAWTAGDTDQPDYAELNPQRNVPVLVHDGVVLTQSLAIIEYLDELEPEPALLPRDHAERAWVRSLALHVACEVQPLNNLRVERYLAGELGLVSDSLLRWRQHWICVGFDAVEAMLRRANRSGSCCLGDTPTLADCALVPQVHNARRPSVNLDMKRWPTIERIDRACQALPAFRRAHPRSQPDWRDLSRH